VYIYDIHRVDTNGDTRYNTYILRSLIHAALRWPRRDYSGMAEEAVLTWTLDITRRMCAKLM